MPRCMDHIQPSFNHGLCCWRKCSLIFSSPDSDMTAVTYLSRAQTSGAARLVLKFLTTISADPQGRWLMATMTSSIVEA